MKIFSNGWTFLSLEQLPFEMSTLFTKCALFLILEWVVIPYIDELIPKSYEGVKIEFLDDPLALSFYIYFEHTLFLIEMNVDSELYLIFRDVESLDELFFAIGDGIFFFLIEGWTGGGWILFMG